MLAYYKLIQVLNCVTFSTWMLFFMVVISSVESGRLYASAPSIIRMNTSSEFQNKVLTKRYSNVKTYEDKDESINKFIKAEQKRKAMKQYSRDESDLEPPKTTRSHEYKNRASTTSSRFNAHEDECLVNALKSYPQNKNCIEKIKKLCSQIKYYIKDFKYNIIESPEINVIMHLKMSDNETTLLSIEPLLEIESTYYTNIATSLIETDRNEYKLLNITRMIYQNPKYQITEGREFLVNINQNSMGPNNALPLYINITVIFDTRIHTTVISCITKCMRYEESTTNTAEEETTNPNERVWNTTETIVEEITLNMEIVPLDESTTIADEEEIIDLSQTVAWNITESYVEEITTSMETISLDETTTNTTTKGTTGLVEPVVWNTTETIFGEMTVTMKTIFLEESITNTAEEVTTNLNQTVWNTTEATVEEITLNIETVPLDESTTIADEEDIIDLNQTGVWNITESVVEEITASMETITLDETTTKETTGVHGPIAWNTTETIFGEMTVNMGTNLLEESITNTAEKETTNLNETVAWNTTETTVEEITLNMETVPLDESTTIADEEDIIDLTHAVPWNATETSYQKAAVDMEAELFNEATTKEEEKETTIRNDTQTTNTNFKQPAFEELSTTRDEKNTININVTVAWNKTEAVTEAAATEEPAGLKEAMSNEEEDKTNLNNAEHCHDSFKSDAEYDTQTITFETEVFREVTETEPSRESIKSRLNNEAVTSFTEPRETVTDDILISNQYLVDATTSATIYGTTVEDTTSGKNQNVEEPTDVTSSIMVLIFKAALSSRQSESQFSSLLNGINEIVKSTAIQGKVMKKRFSNEMENNDPNKSIDKFLRAERRRRKLVLNDIDDNNLVMDFNTSTTGMYDDAIVTKQHIKINPHRNELYTIKNNSRSRSETCILERKTLAKKIFYNIINFEHNIVQSPDLNVTMYLQLVDNENSSLSIKPYLKTTSTYFTNIITSSAETHQNEYNLRNITQMINQESKYEIAEGRDFIVNIDDYYSQENDAYPINKKITIAIDGRIDTIMIRSLKECTERQETTTNTYIPEVIDGMDSNIEANSELSTKLTSNEESTTTLLEEILEESTANVLLFDVLTNKITTLKDIETEEETESLTSDNEQNTITLTSIKIESTSTVTDLEISTKRESDFPVLINENTTEKIPFIVSDKELRLAEEYLVSEPDVAKEANIIEKTNTTLAIPLHSPSETTIMPETELTTKNMKMAISELLKILDETYATDAIPNQEVTVAKDETSTLKPINSINEDIISKITNVLKDYITAKLNEFINENINLEDAIEKLLNEEDFVRKPYSKVSVDEILTSSTSEDENLYLEGAGNMPDRSTGYLPKLRKIIITENRISEEANNEGRERVTTEETISIATNQSATEGIIASEIISEEYGRIPTSSTNIKYHETDCSENSNNNKLGNCNPVSEVTSMTESISTSAEAKTKYTTVSVVEGITDVRTIPHIMDIQTSNSVPTRDDLTEVNVSPKKHTFITDTTALSSGYTSDENLNLESTGNMPDRYFDYLPITTNNEKLKEVITTEYRISGEANNDEGREVVINEETISIVTNQSATERIGALETLSEEYDRIPTTSTNTKYHETDYFKNSNNNKFENSNSVNEVTSITESISTEAITKATEVTVFTGITDVTTIPNIVDIQTLNSVPICDDLTEVNVFPNKDTFITDTIALSSAEISSKITTEKNPTIIAKDVTEFIINTTGAETLMELSIVETITTPANQYSTTKSFVLTTNEAISNNEIHKSANKLDNINTVTTTNPTASDLTPTITKPITIIEPNSEYDENVNNKITFTDPTVPTELQSEITSAAFIRSSVSNKAISSSAESDKLDTATQLIFNSIPTIQNDTNPPRIIPTISELSISDTAGVPISFANARITTDSKEIEEATPLTLKALATTGIFSTESSFTEKSNVHGKSVVTTGSKGIENIKTTELEPMIPKPLPSTQIYTEKSNSIENLTVKPNSTNVTSGRGNELQSTIQTLSTTTEISTDFIGNPLYNEMSTVMLESRKVDRGKNFYLESTLKNTKTTLEVSTREMYITKHPLYNEKSTETTESINDEDDVLTEFKSTMQKMITSVELSTEDSDFTDNPLYNGMSTGLPESTNIEDGKTFGLESTRENYETTLEVSTGKTDLTEDPLYNEKSTERNESTNELKTTIQKMSITTDISTEETDFTDNLLYNGKSTVMPESSSTEGGETFGLESTIENNETTLEVSTGKTDITEDTLNNEKSTERTESTNDEDSKVTELKSTMQKMSITTDISTEETDFTDNSLYNRESTVMPESTSIESGETFGLESTIKSNGSSLDVSTKKTDITEDTLNNEKSTERTESTNDKDGKVTELKSTVQMISSTGDISTEETDFTDKPLYNGKSTVMPESTTTESGETIGLESTIKNNGITLKVSTGETDVTEDASYNEKSTERMLSTNDEDDKVTELKSTVQMISSTGDISTEETDFTDKPLYNGKSTVMPESTSTEGGETVGLESTIKNNGSTLEVSTGKTDVTEDLLYNEKSTEGMESTNDDDGKVTEFKSTIQKKSTTTDISTEEADFTDKPLYNEKSTVIPESTTTEGGETVGLESTIKNNGSTLEVSTGKTDVTEDPLYNEKSTERTESTNNEDGKVTELKSTMQKSLTTTEVSTEQTDFTENPLYNGKSTMMSESTNVESATTELEPMTQEFTTTNEILTYESNFDENTLSNTESLQTTDVFETKSTTISETMNDINESSDSEEIITTTKLSKPNTMLSTTSTDISGISSLLTTTANIPLFETENDEPYSEEDTSTNVELEATSKTSFKDDVQVTTTSEISVIPGSISTAINELSTKQLTSNFASSTTSKSIVTSVETTKPVTLAKTTETSTSKLSSSNLPGITTLLDVVSSPMTTTKRNVEAITSTKSIPDSTAVEPSSNTASPKSTDDNISVDQSSSSDPNNISNTSTSTENIGSKMLRNFMRNYSPLNYRQLKEKYNSNNSVTSTEPEESSNKQKSNDKPKVLDEVTTRSNLNDDSVSTSSKLPDNKKPVVAQSQTRFYYPNGSYVNVGNMYNSNVPAPVVPKRNYTFVPVLSYSELRKKYGKKDNESTSESDSNENIVSYRRSFNKFHEQQIIQKNNLSTEKDVEQTTEDEMNDRTALVNNWGKGKIQRKNKYPRFRLNN